jgi:hypothetical protein
LPEEFPARATAKKTARRRCHKLARLPDFGVLNLIDVEKAIHIQSS